MPSMAYQSKEKHWGAQRSNKKFKIIQVEIEILDLPMVLLILSQES